MKPAICGRCKKGNHCRLRQPGTWVVECEDFEERPAPVPLGSALPSLAVPEQEHADERDA